MSIHSVECNVGTNPITIETGKMARLADGAVVVRSGDTVVLVTVVSATKVKEGQTFLRRVISEEEAVVELADQPYKLELVQTKGKGAEDALRAANAKFERRFAGMEALAKARGLDFSSLTLDEQEVLWVDVKTSEPGKAS